MKTKFIEATNLEAGGINHGKFMVGWFEPEEWKRPTKLGDSLLLRRCGWTPDHILVLDLETGEGAVFMPGGSPRADLNDKHQLWVCPLFERFLTWLYEQDMTDLNKLPALVQLEGAESAMYGYRRTRKVGKGD